MESEKYFKLNENESQHIRRYGNVIRAALREKQH